MATVIDLNVMTKIRRLPTLPGVAIKLLQAIRSENPSIQEISKIISADPPLTAKVLQMVNSPFYGREQKISSLNQAMIFLGLNTVKYLALTFSLMRSLRRKAPGAFDHVQFWKDALTGAVAAKLLAERVIGNNAESAFCLGLLQDIGVLILATLLNGMNLLGIPSLWQALVTGVLILIMIALQTYTKNIGWKRAFLRG